MSDLYPSTYAAIGKLGIPEMRKCGNPNKVAAVGTLGILNPLSTTMIVYEIITGTPLGRLFLANVFPVQLLIGQVSPLASLNLYVINGIAPNISLKTILTGSLPYVVCMVVAIIILCFVPELATWLPEVIIGHSN